MGEAPMRDKSREGCYLGNQMPQAAACKSVCLANSNEPRRSPNIEERPFCSSSFSSTTDNGEHSATDILLRLPSTCVVKLS